MAGPGFRNEFVVVDGEAAGNRIVLPYGNVTIGSDEHSYLRLPVPGVSRRHALLTSAQGHTVLADQQSRKGTWVNGHRITSPTTLADGDLVQFGQVRLRFIDRNPDDGDGATSGDTTTTSRDRQTTNFTPGRSRDRLGTALVFAAGINVVGLVGNGLTAFFTERTPTWTWFIAPLTGLLVALVIETLSYYRYGQAAWRSLAEGHPYGSPGRRRVPRRPLGVSLLATVLVLGGGGWLAATGVSYAVGYFSGNETGVQRLQSQVAAQAQGVTLTVLGVQNTAHFTRVEILVSNGTGSTISLPLSNNAVLTGPDGTTFNADSFRSNWQPRIPAGGQRKGTLNFGSQLPEDATSASLSFATIFRQGIDGPRSITVKNIPLRALGAQAADVPQPVPPQPVPARLMPAQSAAGQLR